MIASAPIPAVAYLRRSTDKQEQSLADQRREIQRYAQEHRFDLINEYVDDAISGTSARKRPGFQQMIEDAKKENFRAIIVWASDRFSRADTAETGHYQYMLRQSGVTIYSVTEPYLAQDDMAGEMMRALKQTMNRQYSVSLSQNTLRGQMSSVQSANDPGRLPPFGYDREVVGPDGTVLYRVRFEPSGDRVTLASDGKILCVYPKGQELIKPNKQCQSRLALSTDERVQIVRDIFTACAAGAGFKQIAEQLNKSGRMSPKGKVWAHTTVKAIIENPVYKGDLVWNRRTMAKFHEITDGRIAPTKPFARSGGVEAKEKASWITLPGTVPAIVDAATWANAQRAASERASCAGGGGKQENRWLLSGVLKCGYCGSAFWGHYKTKGKKAERAVVKTPYYCCAGRLRSGKSTCPQSCHINARQLEAAVLEELQQMVFKDKVCVKEAVDRFVRSTLSDKTAPKITAAKRELEQIKQRLSSIVAGIDPANLSLINDQLTTLRKRREHLEEVVRLGDAQSRDERTLRAFAAERFEILAEVLNGRRDEAARQVVATFIDNVRVDPGTRHLTITEIPASLIMI